MTENNSVNNQEEMTYFNCLRTTSTFIFNRLSPGLYEQYPEKARKIGSSLLGRYKIDELIDHNQFGFTYLVSNLDDKRFLIKEFFPQKYAKRTQNDVMLIKTPSNANELAQFNYLKNFFMGEADNLEKILKNPHPNLLDVTSIVKNQSNAMYIIYSYEEGITLETYLKNKKGQLEHFEIDDILNPLLEAVAHLHTLDIYHFDIKPENILIRKDGSILLMGLEASSLFYDKYDQYYCNGYTPRYAAPEQVSVQKKSSLNAATDIYAIGVLLYNILTGTFPPQASERIAGLRKGEDPYRPVEEQEALRKYDRTLLRMVDKALKFSNKDRFKSIDRVKSALNLATKNNKKKMYGYVAMLAASLLAIAGWSLFSTTGEVSEKNPKTIVTKDTQAKIPSSHNTTDEKNNTTIAVATPKQEKNVEIAQSVDVSINVILSENIGDNKILVNNKVLTDGHFSASEGEIYQIDIINPYYYPLYEERTFVELKEYPEQMFVPRLGKAKMYLKGLPEETQIHINYQSGGQMSGTQNIIFDSGTYEVVLYAGKRFDVTLHKKGYKRLLTESFVLEHGKALTQAYQLEKLEVLTKKEVLPETTKEETDKALAAMKATVTNNFEENSTQQKEIKVEKQKEIAKTVTVKKPTVVKQTKAKKPKKRSVKIIKKNVVKVKQKKRVKKANLQKKKVVQPAKKAVMKSSSGFVWSCSAVANGIDKVHVKHANRKISEQGAIRQCQRKAGKGSACRILNCFLIR